MKFEGDISPTSPKGAKLVSQTDFLVHKCGFCYKLNLSLRSMSFMDR